MNKFFFSSLFLLFSLSGAAYAAEDKLGEGMVNPGYHDKPLWFKESFLDIREDINEATDTNKRVLLYFYQDGCPYCGKMLKDNFGDQRIADYSQRYFDVIAINMWGDREVTTLDGSATTEKQFAKSLKVQFTPTMVFLDESGKVLLRINGYFEPHKFQTALKYVAERQESKLAARDYFKQQAPEAASGKLHQQHNTLTATNGGFDLSRTKSSKPLLVFFEQRVCKACDEMHLDILERPQVQPSLTEFDVVTLDSWSQQPITLPDGSKTTIVEWATKLGITYTPSMLFFDQQANEVFRTGGYLRTFHTKAALDYVASGAYKTTPEFQRYVQKIADDLHDQGIEYDLMD